MGHHFKLSRALNDEERAHMEREGTCLACHQTVPEQSLATSAPHYIAKATGVLPKSNAEHAELLHRSLLLAAWIEVGLPLLGLLGTGAIGGWWWRQRRRRGSATGKGQARSAKQTGEAAADEPSDAGDGPEWDEEPKSDDRG